jgi:citronellyl-CoA dehydrogenase
MLQTFFTEEHDIFRKSVRQYAEKQLAPHSEEWEAAKDFPNEVFREMGKLGFFGAGYPEEHGGSGGDYWHVTVVCEELPRSRMSGLNMALMVQAQMATPVISAIGTPEQIDEFLKPALAGERIAALGISEPGAGSDVANLRTTARRDGGDYVINGSKTFITNGARADFITLAVRTGDTGYGGVSLVLFPTDTKGFKVGRKLEKMGNHTSDTAEIFFEDCRIPRRYLLGEENHGFYYVMQNFQGERLVAAIAGVSGSQLLWEDAHRYANERQAFGRPIAKFQVWRHQLVDLLTEIEAGRWLTYRCVDLHNRKIPCVKEISMAKLYVGEMANRVVDRCVQIHGGYGYIEEYHVCRAYRDLRLLTIGGGTSEIMKEIIGKLVGL